MLPTALSESRSGIFEILAKLLVEVAGIDPEVITEDAAIDGDLEMTSVTFVELQVAIEEEFDILLDPIEVVELNRFGAIVDYVSSLVAEKDK